MLGVTFLLKLFSIYAQRKELKDFTRDVAVKNEDKGLKPGKSLII